MAFDLRLFKGIFFDIYGTLIDWESGIYPQLLSLTQKLPAEDPRREDTPETRKILLRMYTANEKVVEHENPTLAYPKILEAVLWPEYWRVASFSDAVEAMKVLAKHYKLFVLSNVDNESFGRTLAGPLKGVHWDGIYTAELIGSYKPNPRNYNYVVERLKEDFDMSKGETLMVAQGLDIDHVSAKALGFRPAVWIARYAGDAGMGGNKERLQAEGLIEIGAEYASLGEMAEAVKKAFA